MGTVAFNQREAKDMPKSCGEITDISGTTGAGHIATSQLDTRDPHRKPMSVAMGSVVSVATELPKLQIGNHTFRKIRLCVGELASYLRLGDTPSI